MPPNGPQKLLINLNQNKMSKLTYTTSMIQKRVPDEIKAELIEMIDIRVASFKRSEASRKLMVAKVKEAQNGWFIWQRFERL